MLARIHVAMQDRNIIYKDYRFSPNQFDEFDPTKMEIIIVLTGRTFYWLNNYVTNVPYIENIPHDLDTENVAKFLNNTYLNIIYVNNDEEIYIFEVKNSTNTDDTYTNPEDYK